MASGNREAIEALGEWKDNQDTTMRRLQEYMFGSSTGGGATLVADAQSDILIHAIVSRGGRPDLAGPALPKVKASTLLVVGGDDTAVIEMNQDAFATMRCPKELRLVPGATHLFEEPGALEQVAEMAAEWFEMHFKAA
jgi:putative phosphoribosyl transferase